jgi:hypothetical protein
MEGVYTKPPLGEGWIGRIKLAALLRLGGTPRSAPAAQGIQARKVAEYLFTRRPSRNGVLATWDEQ